MLTWLRGLALLRYPALVRDLGERRFHLETIDEISRRQPNVKVDRDVYLVGYAPSRLRLGDRARICKGTVLAFGDETNGFGVIAIGANCWIGENNNLRASGGADIKIGSDCLISQFCTLVGSNHRIGRQEPIAKQGPDTNRLGVTIENDVWLGAGVVLLPGTRVGEGAVVGANAVVTTSVGEYEIWAGVPARKIGSRK